MTRQRADTVVLATKNRGKVCEIRDILAGSGIAVLTLDDFPSIALPPEDGLSFAENAVTKAEYVALVTGCAALADDSGLEVDFIGGRPGVCSARYAGDGATDKANYLLLLKELEGVPEENRAARFRCVIAFAAPGQPTVTFDGALDGYISGEPAGENGFGYDPVFFIPDMGKTAASLTPAEKNTISHRALALKGFKEWLEGRDKAPEDC